MSRNLRLMVGSIIKFEGWPVDAEMSTEIFRTMHASSLTHGMFVQYGSVRYVDWI
jgi:hypothetical protein